MALEAKVREAETKSGEKEVLLVELRERCDLVERQHRQMLAKMSDVEGGISQFRDLTSRLESMEGRVDSFSATRSQPAESGAAVELVKRKMDTALDKLVRSEADATTSKQNLEAVQTRVSALDRQVNDVFVYIAVCYC